MFILNASNLIPLLHNKVYEGYNCLSVTGRFSTSALINIQNFVRSRILEFTIKLEKSIPAVTSIDFMQSKDTDTFNKQEVSQIFNQTIQGNFTVINNSGHNANINVNCRKRKTNHL